APSLQQVWLNNVCSSDLVNPSTGQLEPQNVLTTNNQSRVTKAFGVPDLAEETSINWSGGLTWRPLDNLSLTADAYRITIDGRIVITSQFARNDPDPAVRARVIQILTPFQNREDRNRLEDALPRAKSSIAARYTLGRFGGVARATYYGAIDYRSPSGPANDEHFGAKTLFDLDLSYQLRGGVRLALGGNN